ncbi:O-methyltransferase [Adhaeribacter pallidiroseus]|uniref:Uncharacterized protein n=1 Tax=Adhaeribacter pallidiroseus TaxID=2072847 RepID=A0A369QGE0_9BACT|nr:class I SAM-dependent methyltransferase [Adhaeribacter pallidiroseus]RDC63482.1 hypothetical protein AHMF7616_02086 [Adhaeribacter pallidiroseus]
MIFAFRQVLLYLQHFFKSSRLHGIHSPFVFNLYNRVIRHTGSFYVFPEIENLRRSLYSRPNKIPVRDYGAGSRVKNSATKSIRQIALDAANPPHLAHLLFRLVNFQQPHTILEIGTSLGLTTAYLAAARKQASVYTLEGCPATAQQAQLNLKKLKLRNVQVITGNFEETLPILLSQLNSVDFVLFDGNHRFEPTLRYFEWCLTKKKKPAFLFSTIFIGQKKCSRLGSIYALTRK